MAEDRRESPSEPAGRSESSPPAVAVYRTDAEGRCTYVNDVWCRLAGLTPREAMGDGWIAALHPDDREKISAAWREMVRTGDGWSRTYRFVDRRGKVTVVSGHAAPFTDGEGKVLGYLGTNVDITGKKAAAAALQESELRFQSLFDGAPTPSYSWRADGDDFVLTDANRAAGETTNGKIGGLIGMKASEMYTERPDIIADMKRCLQGRQNFSRSMDYRMHTTGETRRLLASYGFVPPDTVLVHTLDETERHRADEELRKSESRYRTLLESLQEGIIAIDGEAVITFVNEPMAVMLGVESGQMLGRPLLDFIPAESRAEFGEKLGRRREGVVEQHPFTFRHRDGRRVHTLVATSPLKGPAGEFVGAIAGIVDVTSLHEADRELNRISGEFQGIFETTPEMLAVGDVDGCLKKVNPYWKEVLGYPPAELVGKKFVAIVHPDDRMRTKRALSRLRRGGRTDFFEHRFLHRDGSYRWIQWRATFDSASGLTYGAARDISANREAARALEAERRRFFDLLNAIPAVVYLQERDFAIRFANHRFKDLYGDPGSRKCYEVLHGREEPCEECHTMGVMETGEPGSFQWSDDRSGRVFQVVERPFTDVDGKECILKLGTDVTELEEAGQRLQEAQETLEAKVAERTRDLAAANEKLQELDTLKTMFIASMSHELRTPLNAVIGFSGVLLQGMAGELNEEQLRQITMIKSSGDHLLDLVNDVIDVSKIEAGKVVMDREEFDLAEVVDEVLANFDREAGERDINLTCTSCGSAAVRGDRRRIRQILMNLVGNALKFTPKGAVTLSIAGRGAAVETAVTDTGVGIEEADLEKLFRPFSRIEKNDADGKGTGLGLYLSRRLALLLGGDITVASAPGKGSTFTLRLPSG